MFTVHLVRHRKGLVLAWIDNADRGFIGGIKWPGSAKHVNEPMAEQETG